MKLSIIIPAYNAGKYINECIDSILNDINNENDIEILIINDGSTDNTLECIEKYNDSRIKVYNNSNHGVSYSRNFGVDKAKGYYIMYVDADDVLERTWFKCIKEYIECINNDDEKKYYDIIYYSKRLPDIIDKKIMLKYIIGNNKDNLARSGPISRLFKRDFLIENNIIFKENLINGEDMLYNVHAILKTNKFKVVNKSFYEYRQVFNTSSKKFNDKIIDTDKVFQNELVKVLNEYCNDKELIKDIENFCLVNGIITILRRAAYLNKYKKFKKYLYILKEKPYNKKIKVPVEFSKIKRIVIYLIKYHFYFLVFVILKIYNNKDVAKKGNKDKMILY